MDVLTPEQRHKNMKNIRGKDTKPEVILRKKLWHEGIRYRKNWKKLPGKPDIAITKYKIVVFVDGEFWHGKAYEGGGYEGHKYHSLKEQLEHGNNPEFWEKKIEGNMRRDREVEDELKHSGWKVMRFWSRDVLKKTDDCVRIIKASIKEKLAG